MFSGPKKPYSAITVQIERLTSEQYEADDMSGIVDLIEVVRLQASGPTEAARAIRKKLKYGSVHRQLRALTILDGLIQNAGSRFQGAFADEPLLERLRFVATDPVSDAAVKAKCKQLFGQWAVSYKNTQGMERVAALYRELPQRKKPVQQQQSKALKETEVEPDENALGHSVTVSGGGGPSKTLRTFSSASSSTSRPTALSAQPSLTSAPKSKFLREKKSKTKPFNLEKEKPQLLQTLASSSVASTNLMNALKLINRENKRVSEDAETMQRFETCKVLRRQILRYILFVESEQWLGSLIHANEELVNALVAFEVLDKSVEDDSDSEDDEWNGDHTSAAKAARERDTTEAFAGLSFEHDAPPAKPARPGTSIPKSSSNGKGRVADSDESESEEENEIDEEDENDPFADRNAVHEPRTDRPGMTCYNPTTAPPFLYPSLSTTPSPTRQSRLSSPSSRTINNPISLSTPSLPPSHARTPRLAPSTPLSTPQPRMLDASHLPSILNIPTHSHRLEHRRPTPANRDLDPYPTKQQHNDGDPKPRR